MSPCSCLWGVTVSDLSFYKELVFSGILVFQHPVTQQSERGPGDAGGWQQLAERPNQ